MRPGRYSRLFGGVLLDNSRFFGGVVLDEMDVAPQIVTQSSGADFDGDEMTPFPPLFYGTAIFNERPSQTTSQFPVVIPILRRTLQMMATLSDMTFGYDDFKQAPPSILTLDTKQVERCLQTALSTTQPIPTCPITMEALTDWTQIIVTSCNHLFEKYALVTWLDKNKGCPMCRTPCDSVGLRRYPLYKQIYCQNDNRVGWVPFINPLTALCLVSRRELGGGGGGGGGKELKSGER